jgi:hypothetical protein
MDPEFTKGGACVQKFLTTHLNCRLTLVDTTPDKSSLCGQFYSTLIAISLESASLIATLSCEAKLPKHAYGGGRFYTL